MSVFLTPEGKPFYGGTYFPPVRRYNMPAFKEILLTINRLWQEDRGQLFDSGEKISQHLQNQVGLQKSQKNLSSEVLEEASVTLAQGYDWKNGGWGQAPKFPQPMIIEYLLRRATQGDKMALDMAVHALKSMAKGGMYDVVGGGFARYSVDDYWLVPHFEKMLYDNGQLALTYLHAFLVTGESRFKQVCEETLDYILREMTNEEGGFYSSLDADSEGEEGKFYVWSLKEIQEIILNQDDARFLLGAYGVTEIGNFEGQNVLQRVLDDEQLAEEFNLPIDEVVPKLSRLHAKLLAARSNRIRPGTDDKVLVFWNAMMLTAFAEAGRYLHRDDYTHIAHQNANFMINNLYQDNRLLRSWRNGQAKYNAYLEDYAGLILGLLALYQTDPNPKWYQFSLKLADEMVSHFADPEGGFFDTRDDHEALIFRPKDLQDNATPSGNALAAQALLQLSAYGDRVEYRDIAEEMLSAMQGAMTRYPTAFAQWLSAANFALGPTYEVAILGEIQASQHLINIVWDNYHPNLVTAVSAYPPVDGSPKLLSERPLLNAKPTAYVCQEFVCQTPVNTPEELSDQLNA